MIAKTVVIFHDESTFQANDDELRFWGQKIWHFLRPNSKGAGIMVFRLYWWAQWLLEADREGIWESHPRLQRQARTFLEYGENKEGYWTSERFMAQIESAVQIADIKYPREKGYRLVWIFDHSSCHVTYAEDALNANKMNAKPGGKQPAMRNTVWCGKVTRRPHQTTRVMQHICLLLLDTLQLTLDKKMKGCTQNQWPSIHVLPFFFGHCHKSDIRAVYDLTASLQTIATRRSLSPSRGYGEHGTCTSALVTQWIGRQTNSSAGQ